MTESEIDQARELVRRGWAELRGERRAREYPHLPELISAVEPFSALSTLFPFLSVGRLCFSRFAPFPHYYVDFLVSFGRGVYAAEATLESGGWVRTTVLGRGSARDVVALLASKIPSDYGPARLANAETDLSGMRNPLL